MLIICDIANNHNGDVKQGLEIIDAIPEPLQVDLGIKLQYRNHQTFLHSTIEGAYTERFKSTWLTRAEQKQLCKAIKQKAKLVITPFDESSVEYAIEDGVDIFKIASCSALEWSLLEKISEYNKPVICSTGGLTLSEIDKIVSFFEHKNMELSLLHCIAEYPTKLIFDSSRIRTLVERYPNLTVGYSGHEIEKLRNKSNFLALSAGAEIIERHVGKTPCNAYSVEIADIPEFFTTVEDVCGAPKYSHIRKSSRENTEKLRRGVYCKTDLDFGDIVTADKIYFAYPCVEGQTSVQDFAGYRAMLIACKEYKKDEPLQEFRKTHMIDIIREYVHKYKGMLSENKIDLGKRYTAELSHHYGLDQFQKTGAFIVSLINRAYCKKLICMLVGQEHPEHYHSLKEETFQILAGCLELCINSETRTYVAGDIITIERHHKHSFQALTDVIFEEISTTHIPGDSYYTDDTIKILDPMQRKTQVEKL